jgi:hypothetical protein
MCTITTEHHGAYASSDTADVAQMAQVYGAVDIDRLPEQEQGRSLRLS